MIILTTRSGRRIDLTNLQPGDIGLADVASGLSKCCRFAGQMRHFYSVAQHAILVSRLVPDRYRLIALHHDDTESLMGDISRNLKHSDGMQGYRTLEAGLATWLWDALEIDPNLVHEATPIVKTADDLACVFENVVLRLDCEWTGMTQVLSHRDHGFIRREMNFDIMSPMFERLPDQNDFAPWASDVAERQWLKEHHEIVSGVRAARSARWIVEDGL